MYRIIPDTTVSDQINALPTDALPHLAEVLTALELTPWNGRPHHEDNPTGAVRHWTFGPHHAGHLIYLILDDQQEVHLLLIQWLDTTPLNQPPEPDHPAAAWSAFTRPRMRTSRVDHSKLSLVTFCVG